MTAASLIFFGYGNPWYVVLLAASALFNWWVSVRLTGRTITGIPRRADAGPAERADLGAGRPKPRGGGLSRGLLAFGILVNLGLLFYYKYFNFFIDNLNLVLKQDWVFSQVLLPAGISFFTFQQIAWLVDSYRQETGEYGFLDYLLFTVYFPKISMGPILLHGEFIPLLQEEKRRRPDPEYMAQGLMMLAVGLFKKVILAEFFGGAVTWGYDNVASLSAPDAFCVMLAYTFQLYFDFSGYCDMAGGISRMLHLDLPQNFNSPYKALSPVDFWKRWHMTAPRIGPVCPEGPRKLLERASSGIPVDVHLPFCERGLGVFPGGNHWTGRGILKENGEFFQYAAESRLYRELFHGGAPVYFPGSPDYDRGIGLCGRSVSGDERPEYG